MNDQIQLFRLHGFNYFESLIYLNFIYSDSERHPTTMTVIFRAFSISSRESSDVSYDVLLLVPSSRNSLHSRYLHLCEIQGKHNNLTSPIEHVSYGPDERQGLNIMRCETGDDVHIFVHGGFWLEGGFGNQGNFPSDTICQFSRDMNRECKPPRKDF